MHDEVFLQQQHYSTYSDVEALCAHAAHVVPWFLMLSVLVVGAMSGCAIFAAWRRVDILRVD